MDRADSQASCVAALHSGHSGCLQLQDSGTLYSKQSVSADSAYLQVTYIVRSIGSTILELITKVRQRWMLQAIQKCLDELTTEIISDL